MPDTATATPEAKAVATTWAPLWMRLAALAYDLVAAVAIVMVGTMVILGATGQLGQTGINVTNAWWHGPVLYVLVVAYFVVSWIRGGQTLGMRPWGLRLRMAGGQPVRLANAIVRAVIASLPIVLLSLGEVTSASAAAWAMLAAWVVFYAVALTNRERRALHDLLARTVLIRTAPPRRRSRR